MKSGLLAARSAIIALPASATRDECVAEINNLIADFHRSIQSVYDSQTDTYYAMRGDFIAFSTSVFGFGKTSQAAVNMLLKLELNQ